MKTLRIFLADDHDIVRNGLRTLLEKQAGWQIIGEATNGRDCIRDVVRLNPDIVIMDIGMPDLNGVEVSRQILKKIAGVEILIVTMHDAEETIRDALLAGARGYILKTDVRLHLVNAVNTLSSHKPFFALEVMEVVLDGYLKFYAGPKQLRGPRRLSEREREIVRMLAEGKVNKEIAANLGISHRTAETHRNNIMHKLELHSLGELIRYAIRNNIVSDPRNGG